MNKPTKSDVQLLSRALNVARGIVSPNYIKAETAVRKIEPMKKAKGGKVKK
jgi:hypothetical protein